MKTLADSDIDRLKREIAQRLERVRKDQGLTQVELADLLGSTQNMVYRAEADLNLSLSSFLYVVLFFHRNYKLNLEWILSPITKGIPMYTTELRTVKRATDSDDRKRSQHLVDLIQLLAKDNLLPALAASSTETTE